MLALVYDEGVADASVPRLIFRQLLSRT